MTTAENSHTTGNTMDKIVNPTIKQLRLIWTLHRQLEDKIEEIIRHGTLKECSGLIDQLLVALQDRHSKDAEAKPNTDIPVSPVEPIK